MPLPPGKNHMPYPHEGKPKKLPKAFLQVYTEDWDRLARFAEEAGVSNEDMFAVILESYKISIEKAISETDD